MRPWELDAALQRVPPFQRANAALEQYPTAPDIAAGTLAVMRNDGAVDDALLADFGCGTARLSVAAALYGAAFIIAVDVDEDGALSAARQNASDDYPCIDFVRADVAASHFLRPAALDAVVMNPPFGTKRQGVDVAFLARAARSTRSAVYSMHKTSTRDYIARTLQSWHANGQVVAEVRFPIERTLHFHKHKSVDVAVDVWRVDVSQADVNALDAVDTVDELMDARDIGPSRVRNQRAGGRGRARARARGKRR